MRLGMMFLVLAGGACQAVFAAGPALMPMPVKVQPTSGKLAINGNFVVETVGAAGARLAPAVKSFLDRVSRQTGVLYINAGDEPSIPERYPAISVAPRLVSVPAHANPRFG